MDQLVALITIACMIAWVAADVLVKFVAPPLHQRYQSKRFFKKIEEFQNDFA